MRSNQRQRAVDEKPTKLYIIGNGFDLWHGIPSGYWNFKEYVRQHDREVFQAVENYLPAGDDWASLESALADIDVDNIIDDLGQFMPSYGDDDWSDSGHHDFQYEVEQVVGRLSTRLLGLFGEWIRALPIPTSHSAKALLKRVDADATFLTFNYTSTLQDLYAVPGEHVLHIHGETKVRDEELILGHAWNPADRKSLNDRDDISEIDIRLMEAHSIIDGYFSRTFKPSEKLILQHQAFFDQLDAVETVYVLGHSLSDVDLPYLKALLKVPAVAAAHWYVACREERDQLERCERLIQIGVDTKNAVADLWVNL
ncbi:bacteriophage abortive infection AbiH family protein [Pseudoduganella namucuonensis]|uniref:Bacteriophage abortive infection AbiH n=1 Tax=Pseudoduganella namucuonensis TaxID=1035707 RepID=A0A1I7HK33_9BURK|nr:bacteriophage abortive infection AbiH family protein [Pseudoduganella namucuonensis]SFU61120.1 Bacteriophage abortive infection AbiH [Pseudoduganella namucuonensis]